MWNRHNEEDMLDLLKRCSALCRTQSYGGQLDIYSTQDAPLLKKSALTGETSLHEAVLLIGIGLGNIHVVEDVTDLMRYPRATLTPLGNHWGILNMVSCLWSDLNAAQVFKDMIDSASTREVRPCMHDYLAGAEPLAFDAQNTAAIRDAILLAYGGILALEEAGVKRKGLDYWSWLATAIYNREEPDDGRAWLITPDLIKQVKQELDHVHETVWSDSWLAFKAQRHPGMLTTCINSALATLEKTDDGSYKFWLEPEANLHPYTYPTENIFKAMRTLTCMAMRLPMKTWLVTYNLDDSGDGQPQTVSYKVRALTAEGADHKARRLFSRRLFMVDEGSALKIEQV